MPKADKKRLLHQAYRLTTLGAVVERERSKLKKLIEGGVSHEDEEVQKTLERFKAADLEWKQLEAEHLRLRQKLKYIYFDEQEPKS